MHVLNKSLLITSLCSRSKIRDVTHPDYFEQLRFVSERQSIELLTDTLQSSLSLKRRYTAAELLVQLTVLDQVSAIEVQNVLTAAIDDP